MRSIAIQSPSIIYIGAASGGVWKTTNGGTSWTPLTDDEPSLTMGSLAIDPSNSAVLYAGTGEYSGRGPGLYGAGLLKSTDFGSSWTHLPGPWDTNLGGAETGKVVVIPGASSSNPNDDTVVVAGNRGLFRSTDGGQPWDGSNPTHPDMAAVLAGNFSDVIVHPTNSNILYAASNGGGIYRSTDAGQTWDADPSDLDVDPLWVPSAANCAFLRASLAIVPTNTDILYAVFETRGGGCAGGGAVFRTDNAQATTPTFTQLTTPPDWCGSCGYHLAVTVQPHDPDGAGPLNPEDIVYVGGLRLNRSIDGGSTWETLWGIHADVHTFAFDANDALYVGHDGGIDMLASPATAPGANPSWVRINGNLATLQFYPGVSLHPDSFQIAGAPSVLGGTQDNATMVYRGYPQWEIVGGGDGASTAFDFTDPDNIWYVSSQWLDILKTTDGTDAGLSGATTGIPRLNGQIVCTQFIAPFVMCPDDAQVLIATADCGVYRTDTGASNWYDDSPDFGTLWHDSPSALAFAPGSGCNTYFTAGWLDLANPPDNYVYRTTTGGGTTWTDWDDITGNLPVRVPTDLAVHPTNANIVYVSFSGFCGNNASCPSGQGHIWRTTNALAAAVTWTDLTGGKGLPNVPANSVVLDPGDTQRLYVGTDLGAWRSLNGGATWEYFNNGLPNVPVTDLVLNDDTGVLVAATYGRSMFRLTGAIYVDGGWTGYEDGTVQFPYNTVSEGVSAVPIGGQLWVRTGGYAGPGNVPITIDTAMTLRSYDGVVTIGQ